MAVPILVGIVYAIPLRGVSAVFLGSAVCRNRKVKPYFPDRYAKLFSNTVFRICFVHLRCLQVSAVTNPEAKK